MICWLDGAQEQLCQMRPQIFTAQPSGRKRVEGCQFSVSEGKRGDRHKATLKDNQLFTIAAHLTWIPGDRTQAYTIHYVARIESWTLHPVLLQTSALNKVSCQASGQSSFNRHKATLIVNQLFTTAANLTWLSGAHSRHFCTHAHSDQRWDE